MPVPVERIAELVKKGGFETELKVASTLSAAGWRVDQSVYYIDKDEMIGRELDAYSYVVLEDTDNNPQVHCAVSLCIEVKKTSEPFIFFSSERKDFEGGAGYGMFHWRHNVDSNVLSYKDIEREKPLRAPKRIARSYSGLKDGKGQQIKSAILSAVKAAIHYTEECNERWAEGSRDICFFVPVVVVDGDLYECFFEKGSPDLKIEQVQSIVYLQNYMSPNYGQIRNKVYIYNQEAFKNSLGKYEAWAESILSVLQKSRSRMVGAGIGRGGVDSAISATDAE